MRSMNPEPTREMLSDGMLTARATRAFTWIAIFAAVIAFWITAGCLAVSWVSV